MQVCSNFIVSFLLASNKRTTLLKYVRHLFEGVAYLEVLLGNAVLNQARCLIWDLR